MFSGVVIGGAVAAGVVAVGAAIAVAVKLSALTAGGGAGVSAASTSGAAVAANAGVASGASVGVVNLGGNVLPPTHAAFTSPNFHITPSREPLGDASSATVLPPLHYRV